jgi:hypothetical protein
MRNKFTLEAVKAYFLSQDCVLLENEYKNTKTLMRYVCSCGNESKIRFEGFKIGNRCQNCKNKKNSLNNTKYNFKDVQRIVAESGCFLLETQDTYVNSQQRIKFICSCGKEFNTTFSLFLSGRRCTNCGIKKRSATRRQPMENVQQIFAQENYTLLSTEYKNTKTPLQFRCPRGHKHQISLDNWKKGQRCRKCYEEDNVGPNHPNWCEDREAKKLRDSIRRRCFSLLHNTLNLTNQKKKGKSYYILGYTCEELQNHLTSHSNWKKLKNRRWHIDHIYPIDAFLKHNIIDLKIINALENLRPMLGAENLAKTNHYSKRNFYYYLKSRYGIEIDRNI